MKINWPLLVSLLIFSVGILAVIRIELIALDARPDSLSLSQNIGAFSPANCDSGTFFIDTDETNDDTNCVITSDNFLCLCVSDNIWVELETIKKQKRDD